MVPAALLLLGALAAPPLVVVPQPPAAPGQSPFQRLVARHAASTMLKQLALDDLVGKAGTWDFDRDAGTLRFGQGKAHPIQLLGTEAAGDRTWLWAWANEESELPPKVLVAAGRLRKIGLDRRLQELYVRKLPLAEADGHRLAAIAVGLLGAGSYYRGPYGSGERQGAAFFLLTDFPRPDQVDGSALRLLRAVEMVTSTWELDHREVVRGLAADLKLRLEEKPDAITLTSAKGEPVRFLFDERGRLSRMRGQAGR